MISYPKKGLVGGECTIFYDVLHDGGGTTIGYDMCKHPDVLKYLTNIDKTLEICCGPGFIGYYLLFNKLTKSLWLSDKFDGVRGNIELTNETNNVHVPFIHSDCFREFPSDLRFDLIIGNPPHFQEDIEWIWNRKTKEEVDSSYRVNLDKNLRFHKEFFLNVKDYLNPLGKIIFVENQSFISDQTLIDLAGNDFDHEVVHEIYKENKLYYIILTLK